MDSGTGPSGSEVRTFLIADVRGYTRFTQQEGDEAAARLAARFAQVVQEAVEARGGTVVELRGDEALCVFGSSRQAVRAAVALQQRCAEEIRADPSLPLRVGVGLDAGEAVAVGGGYRGGALNLAARLCSLAKAGEVLVSEGVVHFGHRVDDVVYADRGQVRLKGLARPVRYHQAQFTLNLPPEERPRPRLGRRVAIVAVPLLAAALVAGAVLLRSSGDPEAALAANAIGEVDAASGEVISQTPLRGSPRTLAVGLGHVWTADPAGSRIVGVDLDSGTVAPVRTGGGVDAVAVTEDSIWVLHGETATVERLDPFDQTPIGAPASVGAGASAMAVARGDVWVANSDEGTVQRIDGRTGRASAPLPVGPQPVAIAAGMGAVWVLDEAGGTLTEIDPRTGKAASPVPLLVGATAIAAGHGAIWLAHPPADAVLRFDPADPAAVRQIDVPGRPTAVAVAGGAVWAGTASGSLHRIDPRTLDITRSRELRAPVAALAAAGERLFVAAEAPLSEHRGGRLRVVMAAIDSLDPAVAYSPESWSVLSITNDGLLAFRRVGGATGSLLVPDLATAMPQTTDDGRTYRFRLRPDVRYSNGEPVRARDFRTAVERALTAQLAAEPGDPEPIPGPGATFFSKLLGASDCRPGGSACDMSRAVVTDDAARTVEFRLTGPDTAFLYGLALPFSFAVPPGLAPGEVAPATGAYMIRRYRAADGSTPGTLELVRNPRFRVWSPVARPDGFPDRITWQLGAVDRAALARVERGLDDVAVGSQFGALPQMRRVAREHPSQVHDYATGQVLGIYLNTKVPPFHDVRARRAVAFALDRRKLTGRTLGRVTCQIIPPGIAGYRPYCPFTPGGGPAYRGPDFAAARRLVRASGTARTPVTVWVTDIGSQQSLRYTAKVLERLGYRVRTRFLPQHEYFSRILAPGSTMQIGAYGWIPDYPAAADYLATLFTCGSEANPSRYCSRELDRRIRRATELDPGDPAAAALAWAAADEHVTDAAVWVPFVNPSSADLLAPRVGNYLRNPQWGLLIEQLWVE